MLRGALSHPDLKAVWWAPPCGTASLARCIPLDIPNAPRPLRTLENPDGDANLSPVEQARVDAANCLYHALADSVKETSKRGVIHIVENPRGSLFWRTTAWPRARDLFQYTAFQACAYGGRRPKRTALAFTHPAFAKFCRSCPSCPDHLPWGLSASGWATSEEAVYPIAFCEQVAATLVHIFEQPDHGIDYHQMRASTGLQPKASKVRPVVPEHKQVVVVRGPLQFFRPPCLHMERIHDPIALHSACQCELRCLPSGAQLLRMHSSDNQGDSLCVSVWGIPYSPDEFIEAALHAGHPALAASDLPPPLAHAIADGAAVGHPCACTGRRGTGLQA